MRDPRLFCDGFDGAHLPRGRQGANHGSELGTKAGQVFIVDALEIAIEEIDQMPKLSA